MIFVARSKALFPVTLMQSRTVLVISSDANDSMQHTISLPSPSILVGGTAMQARR